MKDNLAFTVLIAYTLGFASVMLGADIDYPLVHMGIGITILISSIWLAILVRIDEKQKKEDTF